MLLSVHISFKGSVTRFTSQMDNREIRKLLTLKSNFTGFALNKRKKIRTDPQSPPPSEFIYDGLRGQEPINMMGSCGGP